MAQDGLAIQRDDNVIRVSGRFGMVEYRRMLAAVHNAVAKRGYEDLVLDFTNLAAAYLGPMLALCSEVAWRREQGVDFHLRLPTKQNLKRLFVNAGWAYHLDPEQHQDSTYTGYVHVPLIQFASPNEQQTAVNRMVDAILAAQTELSRSDLAAIEWAANEITDNVMNHADTALGGYVQLTNQKARGRVEFAVADHGVGIRATLQNGHPDLRSDAEALDLAVREGVTRDRKVGQGNGLFGTFEVAQVGTGYLHVHSGVAGLNYGFDELHTKSEPIPLNGTLVVAGLDITDPEALGRVLRFEGQRYEPVDYLETRYEHPDRDLFVFRLKEEAASFGSRKAGEPVRNKVVNLINMNPEYKIVVDCSDVPLVSSSFADEVFGKLFLELGPLQFMQTVDIQGMSDTVSTFVDRAILQRSKEEP